MTGFAALAMALAMGGTNIEWTGDTTMKIEATVQIDDPMAAFPKGEKAMKKAAKAACKEKGLGKPKKVSDATLSGIGITPEGKKQVTLNGTYACG